MNHKLRAARRAGRVLRYHTSGMVWRENVAEHTFNVMNILMVMTDGQMSHRLLEAALLHDQGEYVSGDIPSPVKKLLGPGARQISLLEEQGINTIHNKGEPKLTDWEYLLLKVADNLDGLLKCTEEVELGNKELIVTGSTYSSYLEMLLPKLGSGPAALMVEDAMLEFHRLLGKTK